MATLPKKGSLVLSLYVVDSIVAENKIYLWAKARNTGDGSSVVLQIAQPHLSQDETDKLFYYFEKLQDLKSKKGFLIPEVGSNSEYSLVLTYTELGGEPLLDELHRQPAKAKTWWKQAAFELLHSLHQKSLVHGNLTLDSFVVIDNQVRVRGFGYAPLLESKHPDVIEICGDSLISSDLDRCGVTSAIDIYAFGKAVACWQPQLESTDWYRKATNVDPSKRFQKMRDLFDELEKAFEEIDLDKMPPPVPKVPATGATTGGLIPKFELTINIAPTEGGKVLGSEVRVHEEGKRVSLKTEANKGWKFDRWSGAVTGKAESAELVIDEDKTVTAHFIELKETLPEEAPPIAPPKGTFEIIVNPVKWAVIFMILSGVFGGAYILSPKISFLCHPLGNCQEFTDAFKEAEDTAQNTRIIIEKSENIEEFKTARDRLKLSTNRLVDTIPSNAKIYADVQQALPSYKDDLRKIDARIFTEEKAQKVLNDVEAIAGSADAIAKEAEKFPQPLWGPNDKAIQKLNQANTERQNALYKLETIPADSIARKQANIRAQEYKRKIQEDSKRINLLVSEGKKRIEALAIRKNQLTNTQGSGDIYTSTDSTKNSEYSNNPTTNPRDTDLPPPGEPLWDKGSAPPSNQPPQNKQPLW